MSNRNRDSIDMDRNKLEMAGVIVLLLILLIIAAVIFAYLTRSYFPQTTTNSIGVQVKNLSGTGPLDSVQYADNGSIGFYARIDPSDDCLLMALVDYQVVPFYFNGSYNKTHYLTGSRTNEYPGIIRVVNLTDGFHDVTIIGFVAPCNFTYDRGVRSNLMTTGSMRFNVIAGNGMKPVHVFENSSTTGNATYRIDYNFSGPNILRAPFDNKQFYREDVKPGQVLDYYLQVGHATVNGKKLNTSYAIIQLLNYDQVPIRYNTPDTVYYGYISANEYSSVHLSLKAPSTAGPYRLAVLLVTDPYASLEAAPGIMNTNITQYIQVEYIDLFVSG